MNYKKKFNAKEKIKNNKLAKCYTFYKILKGTQYAFIEPLLSKYNENKKLTRK